MSAEEEPPPPGAEDEPCAPGLEARAGAAAQYAQNAAGQTAVADAYDGYGSAAAYPPGFEYYSSYYYPAYTTGEAHICVKGASSRPCRRHATPVQTTKLTLQGAWHGHARPARAHRSQSCGSQVVVARQQARVLCRASLALQSTCRGLREGHDMACALNPFSLCAGWQRAVP